MVGAIHARAALLAGAELAGVSASTAKRAAEAAQRLRATGSYASADDLVRDPDVDVVHICTPNDTHLPLALAAIEHGKHVVCEKPIALDGVGGRRLAHAARDAGVVATVPFVYRYNPTVREARARVRAGEAGDLRLIHGGYLQDWLLRPGDTNWRVSAERGGPSRAFADIGSHWCDLVEFVSGDRIAQLSAQVVTAIPERAQDTGGHAFGGDAHPAGPMVQVGTEDMATVMLRFAGGAVGTLIVSQISPGRKNRLHFEISGSHATLAFDQEEAEKLWVGRREGSSLVVRDPETLHPDAARYATLPAGHAQGYDTCFELFVRETYAAITQGGPIDGLPDAEDGARSTAITDAVLASARAGGAWETLA
jgi:predicted dehydrogenase